MSAWWWSWLLTLVGVTGFVLAGRRVWWCWYVNLACQGLWLAYALVTRQYGFIAAAVVYVVVFGRNAVRWTRDDRRPAQDVLAVTLAANVDGYGAAMRAAKAMTGFVFWSWRAPRCIAEMDPDDCGDQA